MVGAQGQVTSTKKVRKHTIIMTLPTAKTKPKTKKNY